MKHSSKYSHRVTCWTHVQINKNSSSSGYTQLYPIVFFWQDSCYERFEKGENPPDISITRGGHFLFVCLFICLNKCSASNLMGMLLQCFELPFRRIHFQASDDVRFCVMRFRTINNFLIFDLIFLSKNWESIASDLKSSIPDDFQSRRILQNF